VQDFIDSDSRLAERYPITEFNNILIVGITKNLDEIIVIYEICGYIAASQEDLITHKNTHESIFI